MRGVLVVGVAGWFELEGAVVNVEVVGQALAERIQHPAARVVRKDVVVDDDVNR